MGLGSTAKKLQKVASIAEETYKRMNELREQLQQLRAEVEETSQQVDVIEHDLAEQRALLEAMAEREGIDVDRVIADANIQDVDIPVTEAESAGSSTESTSGTEAASGAEAAESSSDGDA